MSFGFRGGAARIVQAVRAWRLRRLGAELGPRARLAGGVTVHRGWGPPGAGRVRIAAGCQL
jgi:hypothetical protein